MSGGRTLMPAPELCTEDEVTQLVHAFYSRVRDDEVLGPIFAAHVEDWDVHLPKMVAFWSSALRGSKRYRGTPMPVHAALPGLTQALFERWLDLFAGAAGRLENREMAERAVDLAKRIAQSLWYGYQLSREPQRMAASLPLIHTGTADAG
jgi:hemoglobin